MTKTNLNPEERAVEIVRRRNEGHTDFRIGAVIPRHLHGALYIVLFNKDGQGFENYAFIPDNSDQIEAYRNAGQLAHAVSLNTRTQSFFGALGNFVGMSSVIAILITITICYLAINAKGDLKIPDVLSNALTLILGFYFGSKAIERKD